MKASPKFVLSILVVILTLLFAIWFGIDFLLSSQDKDPIFVMYAGSLIDTFESSIGPNFESESNYFFVSEGRGSIQISNMIMDGQRQPDVFVSAGSVPMLMLSGNDPPLINWFIRFASAEIVISYSHQSSFFDDLERARHGDVPWYEVLSKDELKFRRTDPEIDPKGYYTIIAMRLANIFYDHSEISDVLLGEFRNPVQLLPEEVLNTILEAGQIDAVASYKHEAISRDLPYVKLPNQINLGDPIFSNFYRLASYTLESERTVHGEPIYFVVTIPSTATNVNGAIDFIAFLLSDEGMELLQKDGLNPVEPIIEGDVENVPPMLRKMLRR